MRQFPALSVLLGASVIAITAAAAQTQTAPPSNSTDFGIREVGTRPATTEKLADELGTFSTIQIPIGFGAAATAINAEGDVAGNYGDENGNGRGFILRNGSAESINYPTATDSAVFGMNDIGALVGFYSVEGNNNVFGFLFDNGRYSNVNYPGATVTQALGVNDLGDVAGFYRVGSGPRHGFLRLRAGGGSFSSIDYPGAAQTRAQGINSKGAVVGQYTMSGSVHGFLLSNGQFTSIDYPGANQTEARGINVKGEIVGIYQAQPGDPAGHGFLLSGGTYRSIDFPNAISTRAFGINTEGDVVGDYIATGDDPPQSFIWKTR